MLIAYFSLRQIKPQLLLSEILILHATTELLYAIILIIK